MNPSVLAPVKSAWYSKVNWVQFAGPTASLLAALGLDLKPEQLVGLILALQTGQSVATWIFRTWFSSYILKASVPGVL